MVTINPSEYGQLAVADAEEAEGSGIRVLNYAWTPAARLAEHLPSGFEIKFETIDISGGRRVTTPLAALLPWALAGDAILRSRGELANSGGCYDQMRLISMLGPHLRERIGPRKFSTRELRGKSLGAKGILPHDFGAGVEGGDWSVNRMLDEGLRAAKSQGVARPTLQDQIVYGIDAEAQIHPISFSSLSVSELTRLVRLAVFDVSPSDQPIDDALKARVYSRVVRAIGDKLDLSQAEFNDWFHHKFDNVIHAIAKKKHPDGRIDNKVVRGTLIELIFDSWGYLAQTIEAFAHHLADSFSPPLQGVERVVFETFYCRSRQLGNLPLILVANISIAKPAIKRLLGDPMNEALWGQLLRVLTTHREMIAQRRADDRRKKMEKNQRPDDAAQAASIASEFQGIGEELVELSKVKCSCGSRTPRFETRVDPTDHNVGTVCFVLRCKDCNELRNLHAPIEQCEQLRARQRES